MKKTLFILPLVIAVFILSVTATVQAFSPSQSCGGGSFFNSVSSTGNFSCGTPSSGSGSVSTSSAITQYQFPYWSTLTGGLSGTSTLYINSSTGFIGIGTTTPSVQLYVDNTNNQSTTVILVDNGTGSTAQIGFLASSSNQSFTVSNLGTGNLVLKTNSGNSSVFRGYSSGDVSISGNGTLDRAPVNIPSTPPADTTSSLLLLGNNLISSGSAAGTFIGINASTGDYVNFQNSSNTVFQIRSNSDVTINSSTDNGLFSVINASGTDVFQVASTTNSANLLQVLGSSSQVYFGVSSSGVPLMPGTTTATSIGGSSLALDACTSTVTVVPVVLSTSTEGFPTYPQVHLNPSIFNWQSYISAVGTASTTITTEICDELAAGFTPTSTKFNIFFQRETGF